MTREMQLGIVSAAAMTIGAGLLFGAAGAGGLLMLFGFFGFVIAAADGPDLNVDQYPQHREWVDE